MKTERRTLYEILVSKDLCDSPDPLTRVRTLGIQGTEGRQRVSYRDACGRPPLPAERPPSHNNVETRGIIIEDGAVLRGKVEVHQKDQPPQPPRPAVPAHAKEAVATAFRKGSMCKILSYAISSRSSFLTTRDPTIRTMGHHLGNYRETSVLGSLIQRRF
jgi:hypothetical protein